MGGLETIQNENSVVLAKQECFASLKIQTYTNLYQQDSDFLH